MDEVFIIIHTRNNTTRMIPQVFASRELAEESIKKTVPTAMRFKGTDIWHMPTLGQSVEIKKFRVLKEAQVML